MPVIVVPGVQCRERDREILGAARLDHEPIERTAIVEFSDRVITVARPDVIGVVAEATEKRIVAEAAVEGIVAVTTVERIGTVTANQDVVAAEAVQGVVTAEPEDQIVAVGTVQRRIVARRSHDDVERLTIGKLQALDVANLVGAVTVFDGVCHLDAAVGIAGEDVFAGGAREHRGIGIGDRVACRHDLAHDLELSRIDRTGEHRGGERRHAVVPSDFDTVVDRIANTDVDVQPLVAVDDVIAHAARDPVAAVAAEEDVTRGVRGDARAEDPLQARDESDALCRDGAAGEALGAALGRREAFCGQRVGAGQDIVELRTRHTFDRLVGVERAVLLAEFGNSSNTIPRVRSASTPNVLSL